VNGSIERGEGDMTGLDFLLLILGLCFFNYLFGVFLFDKSQNIGLTVSWSTKSNLHYTPSDHIYKQIKKK